MGIDFGGIIGRSFRIAFKYPSLWIFGLFVGGHGWNFDVPDKLTRNIRGDNPFSGGFGGYSPHEIERFFEQNIEGIIGVFILVVLIIIILAIVCQTIAKGSLIDAVNKITRGGTYTFGSSFSRGLDFFWRLLGIGLIALCLTICLVGVIVLGAIATPFTLILTIPLFIAAIVPIWHTFALSEVALVARDNDIGAALSEGWELLWKNVGNITIITLIYIGLLIGFLIVLGIVGLVLFLPVGLIVMAITNEIWIAILLGLIIGLPISIVLGGITGVFFESLYVQFYFQLLEPGPAQPLAFAGPQPPMQNPPGFHNPQDASSQLSGSDRDDRRPDPPPGDTPKDPPSDPPVPPVDPPQDPPPDPPGNPPTELPNDPPKSPPPGPRP